MPDQTKSMDEEVDEWLAQIYDLAVSYQAFHLLLYRLEKDLPQCHAKDMIRGKLRGHISRVDLEIQRQCLVFFQLHR